MNESLWLLTLLLNTVITLRLLLFKARRGQQRRLAVGVVAWVLIVFNAAYALYVGWGWIDTGPWQAAFFALLAGGLLRSRGNMARLLG